MKNIIIVLLIYLSIFDSYSQSFYREKEPKTKFYEIGLGAGTFFPAPRSIYDRIENQIVPTFTIASGRKYANHFSLIAIISSQQFSSNGQVLQEGTKVGILEPIFNGYNYTLELTPTLNLLPSYHHMRRAILDLNAGIGLGYLLTYRREKFVFRDKKYEFSYFKSSVYIPLRVGTVFRAGKQTDLKIEGVFLYTFLNNSDSKSRLEKNSDHFGQINLIYRKYFGRIK